ncbi:MAG: hypothetical protein GXP24_10715 [Planctomycetes bacterium]|nr:hypothetical protein [Planctomycetota bacterium]
MPNPIMRKVIAVQAASSQFGGERITYRSQGSYIGNMARNTTRVGRRRRVLNEEVLSASNIAARSEALSSTLEPGDTPRYGVGANIENHPQVTSFVPRRFRTLSLIALCGLAAGTVAELIAHHAQSLSELTQVVTPAEITEVFASRLVAWTSATLLLLTFCYTRLIFSLRRHRVDDYRGRYRVWRTAGWAAILLSVNAVLGAHELVARCLGNLVDWQLLPSHAGWWLAPAALLGGWLLIKLLIDAAECRSALTFYLLAVACLTVAGVHSAGWSPEWAVDWPGLLSRSLPLAGYTMLLIGSLLFARYVILDVQGLIEHQAVEHQATVELPAPDVSKKELPSSGLAEKFDSQERAIKPALKSETSTWVDGSEPELDDDQQSTRRLSKAERKRLRKQKQRNRAA